MILNYLQNFTFDHDEFYEMDIIGDIKRIFFFESTPGTRFTSIIIIKYGILDKTIYYSLGCFN